MIPFVQLHNINCCWLFLVWRRAMLRPIFRTQIKIYRFESAVTYLEFGKLIVVMLLHVSSFNGCSHRRKTKFVPTLLRSLSRTQYKQNCFPIKFMFLNRYRSIKCVLKYGSTSIVNKRYFDSFWIKFPFNCFFGASCGWDGINQRFELLPWIRYYCY